MPVDASVRQRRVFFALWPDAALADRLDQLAQQAHEVCGGRRMRRESVHMTLAFIGEVPDACIDTLRHAVASVTATEFSMCLDRIACWERNRIVWMGCGQEALPLLALVNQLAECLKEVELSLDIRNFVAHVTLLRNAHCERLPEFPPLVWPVSDFVLAETCVAAGSTNYKLLDRWPLAKHPG